MTWLKGVCSALLLLGAIAAPGRSEAQEGRDTRRGVETLRIAGSAHDLSTVLWVVGFPSGRVAVGSLPADGAVRWFDGSGRPLRRFGRSGEGPGEFRAPVAAGRFGDTLWVLDRATQRVTMIRPDPASQPSFTTLTVPTSIEPSGALSRQVIGSVSGIVAGRRLLFQGVEVDPAVQAPSASLHRTVIADSAGRAVRTLKPFEPRGACQVPYVSGKTTGFVGVFFCARPIFQAGQTGEQFAVVTSDNASPVQSSFTVRLYSAEALLLFEKTMRVPAHPIPKNVADSIQRGLLERARSPEARAARSRAKIPPAYPPVMDVVLSDAGDVWLGMAGAAALRTWIVFDIRGMRQRDVLLPKTFRPAAVLGRDVLGTEVDPDDFIDIVRYRVGG